MNRIRKVIVALALSVLGHGANALEAGWRQLTVGAAADAPPIVVALYYPTRAPSQAVTMGPFALRVAVQGPPEPAAKGLVVLSHGTGGSELAHSSLAEALARDGYIVAALRHPGDNWQDRSLLKDRSGVYFSERPRQVTRVIDALLSDPQWSERIARDAAGPRIGAVGHSAGGYTVLALAGGVPDAARIVSHCSAEAAEDPVFCELGKLARQPAAAPPAARPLETIADPRIRAVVALAPLGVVFTAPSLAAIKVPVALYEAEGDRFLVPRFHAEWIARNLPGAQIERTPNAWHFAYVDRPSMAIGSEDGDIGADPAGFDRRAFLAKLGQDIPAFFDRVLR